jgi:hypothetical protein
VIDHDHQRSDPAQVVDRPEVLLLYRIIPGHFHGLGSTGLKFGKSGVYAVGVGAFVVVAFPLLCAHGDHIDEMTTVGIIG